MLSFKSSGITLSKYSSSKIFNYLKAIKQANGNWWLPFNRNTLARLGKIEDEAIEQLKNYSTEQFDEKIILKREDYSWLRDYQFEDLQKFINRRNSVNFSEMRTGRFCLI